MVLCGSPKGFYFAYLNFFYEISFIKGNCYMFVQLFLKGSDR